MHFLLEEEDDEEIEDDPAVIAGKRSYLHALAEAKKRKREEAARRESGEAEANVEEPPAPLFTNSVGGATAAPAAADETMPDLAEASNAWASSAGNPAAAKAALESLSAITSTLERVAAAGSNSTGYIAPKPKASARVAPYSASG